MDYPISTIVGQFNVAGTLASVTQIPNGHINDTFVVALNEQKNKKAYLLQRINHFVFQNVQGLMNNILTVTHYLQETLIYAKKDPFRHGMTFLLTHSECPFYFEPTTQSYWRLSHYIDGIVFNKVEQVEDFHQCGIAFGQFQRMLDQFDASKLIETIPSFHNTQVRFDAFLKAIEKDQANRVDTVKTEIEFLIKNKEYASMIVDAISEGKVPLRVTHNDTKLNNVIFDKMTREAICVVDLDTIMPGSLLYDFGDAIRYGANTASEDELDLSKVDIDLTLFDAFTKGFIQEVGAVMSDGEIALLAVSPIVLTYELALRFLTDYLNGDTYFKIHHPQHNLDRTRVQIALVIAMEAKLKAMQAIVEQYV